ncbi:SWIB/MDM2 domain-containing protein [Lineolata rhizophorae]|uniref:SWIB/MDM2 domain-containing protein n=1 Tax=Lineolata rhizophorae TaxID=578093 RepID=A0A6A6NTS8_9PEZI|nr:SWIB/MDM2 domain-containing protein [Lineolata rhizophorae]
MARFDKFTSESNGVPDAPPPEPAPSAAEPPPTTNGVKKEKPSAASSPPASKKRDTSERSEQESELSETVGAPVPPQKRQKVKATSIEDSDAAYAARLQAEENSRARSTRGGGANTKRKPVVKKTQTKKNKKKSAKSVDDSDVESGSGEAEGRKVNRSGGFHKPLTLSPALSELLGETSLSRPQTVKKIWDYVKAHDLQDPNDKRHIRCDEPMRAVFKQDRIHMFTMNKILGQNLYAADE